ncbi:MAG: MarP family serine protease [Actinomycetota bacterium]|nr:MarP family serine protease [Actinomycetota bacterium]
MTPVDWIIVGFTLLLALYGYAQGFIVGALSLVGFAAGAFLGTRIAPALLPGGSHSPYAPLFGLLGALIAGAILATGLEGVGWALRQRVAGRGIAVVDGALGGLLTAALALGLAWLGGAVALQTPGATKLREAIQRSTILSALNGALPPSGAILNALARFDPFPQITGPPVNVAPPNSKLARDPQIRADAPGVVRVLGTACGLGIEGSGWIGAPGTVVTNAHVVAGTDDSVVQLQGTGPKLDATPVHFDARNDVAVLRVRGLGGRTLSMARAAAPGTPGAVLGFPENGPYDVEPARLGETRTVISQDAYGRGPVTREITSLRARVRHGNSGGPVVDGDGRVLATVFAAAVGAGTQGGYANPDDVVRGALADRGGPRVGTGPCAP